MPAILLFAGMARSYTHAVFNGNWSKGPQPQ
jgi:hypothetical protein